MAGTQERLISQYKYSPNLIALFEALIDNPMFAVIIGLLPLYDLLNIDTMEGVQLDNIGKIVVQPRPNSFNDEDLYESNTFLWGNASVLFEDDPDHGWGSLDTPNSGGVWGELQISGKQLKDSDYRLLLKGKIHANNTIGTVYEIEQFGKIVFGNYCEVYPYAGGVLVFFPYYINPIAIEVVKNTLTVAKGIELTLAVIDKTNTTGNVFRVDTPNAIGDLNDPSIGYPVCSLV